MNDDKDLDKERIRGMFDAMPSALISIQQDHTIMGWNKYMVQKTNISSKSAYDKKLNIVFPAITDYMNLIDHAFESKTEQHIAHVRLIINPEDLHKLYYIVVYPIQLSDHTEAVIRIDDITEQVKQEVDLAQVEKLASVGASIAGVAHEINNPLSGIMQNVQNVLRRVDPKLQANVDCAEKLNLDLDVQHQYLEQREILEFLYNIQSEGDRASKIVKNMLKFTRRSAVDMSTCNLVEIMDDGVHLAEVESSIQDECDFKEIEVNHNYKSYPIMIECCPVEIQQVILNIVKNSAQALEHQPGKKIINIDVAKEDDHKIKIEISDNGPGMTEDVKKNIFQPFFTTKEVGHGTGLGLSVCRNIVVQRHHGNLDVESKEGHGTKFTIMLPVEQPS